MTLRITDKDAVRLIAFYLPQFYPIPENDEWWGKGFTEWTMVAQGRPAYKGHYQPHIPAELGFYDLRYPEVREKQARLAAEHGIHGFCYYHYWMKGKRLLELPFGEVLSSGRPEFPFCLCWGNHNWTRRWDGREDELLIRQEYSAEDDLEHIQHLITAFRDDRYIKIGGKPLFAVHLAQFLPDPERTASVWRDAVSKAGFPGLYLVSVENNYRGDADNLAPGFDAAIEFAPDIRSLGPALFDQAKRSIGFADDPLHVGFLRNNVHLYDSMARNMLEKPVVSYKRFPCVCPSWDNSPRRQKTGGAVILHGSSPDKFREFIERAIGRAERTLRGEERLVFINAWNEWSEGCHLEPDCKYGTGFLAAVKDALVNASNTSAAGGKGPQPAYMELCDGESGHEEKYLRSLDLIAADQDEIFSAQLFVDTGNGFSGAEMAEINFSLRNGARMHWDFDLNKYDNIRKLRIDPISGAYSVIELLKIEMVWQDGTKSEIKEYISNSITQNVRELIFDTVDPQIHFYRGNNGTPARVVIDLEFKKIGESALGRALEELKTRRDKCREAGSLARKLTGRIAGLARGLIMNLTA